MDILVTSRLPVVRPRPEHLVGPSQRNSTDWTLHHHLNVEPKVALLAIQTWLRLHGFVSLEIAGNFVSIGIDPDPVFRDRAGSYRELTKSLDGSAQGVRARPGC